jgi:hypothetical protein
MGNYLCFRCCENEEKGEMFVPMEVKYWSTIPEVLPWSRQPTPIFTHIECQYKDGEWVSPTIR